MRRGEEWEEGAGQGKCDVSAEPFYTSFPGAGPQPPPPRSERPRASAPGIRAAPSQYVGGQEAEDGRLRAARPPPRRASRVRVPLPGAHEQRGAGAPAAGEEVGGGRAGGGRVGDPPVTLSGQALSARASGNLRPSGSPLQGATSRACVAGPERGRGSETGRFLPSPRASRDPPFLPRGLRAARVGGGQSPARFRQVAGRTSATVTGVWSRQPPRSGL